MLTFVAAAGLAASVAGLVVPTAAAAPGGDRLVFLIPGQEPVPGTLALDMYKDMDARLTGLGYKVVLVPTGGLDLVRESYVVKDAVANATRGANVESIALVGHSYGALSARNYIRALGGVDVVDTYIGIGAPQYGTPGGCFQLPGSGFDGCPVTPFINSLNTGDDTPGNINYYSIRGTTEPVDGRLDGGQCRMTTVPDVNHLSEVADPRVIDLTVNALQGNCVGTFVNDPDGSISVGQTLLPGPN